MTSSTADRKRCDEDLLKRPISIEVRLVRCPAPPSPLHRALLDDGGIYKGRFQHRERVREIEDTRDTKVDLPVDYRELETVEVSHPLVPLS